MGGLEAVNIYKMTVIRGGERRMLVAWNGWFVGLSSSCFFDISFVNLGLWDAGLIEAGRKRRDRLI